jgi:hypothetical protein
VGRAGGSPRILQSVYQVGVTRDCVIRMDTVFKLGAEQLLTAPSSECPAVEHAIRNLLDFRQSDFTNLYIISRRDLTPDRKEATVRRVTLKCGTAHFLVDYDNPDQRITLHSAHNTGWDAAEWHRPYDSFPSSDFPGVVGMATGSTDINVLGRYVLDGKAERFWRAIGPRTPARTSPGCWPLRQSRAATSHPQPFLWCPSSRLSPAR